MTEVLVRAAMPTKVTRRRCAFQSLPFASQQLPSITHTMNATTAIRSLTRASQQSLRNHIGLQRTWPAPSASLLRKPLQTPQTPLQRLGVRCHSTESSNTRAPRPLTDRDSIPEEKVLSDKDAIAARKALQPCYDMTFTCKKCLDRSSHRITKQAYHFGTVLINCPGCKSRHLIADHMKQTGDMRLTSLDRFSQTKASLSKTS
jgi:protein import protein ZIM17